LRPTGRASLMRRTRPASGNAQTRRSERVTRFRWCCPSSDGGRPWARSLTEAYPRTLSRWGFRFTERELCVDLCSSVGTGAEKRYSRIDARAPRRGGDGVFLLMMGACWVEQVSCGSSD
jgi:hypothetical protein